MATKFFCDVCEKEISRRKVVRVWGDPENTCLIFATHVGRKTGSLEKRERKNNWVEVGKIEFLTRASF